MDSIFNPKTANYTRPPVVALPAATVIPIRERPTGFEVLLIYRNPQLKFQGGLWAFPGGRIEAADYLPDSNDILTAARRAAVREAAEEAGFFIDADTLIHLSRWTTPRIQPKRYKTWFFVAIVADQSVRVDGEETLDYMWARPARALEAQRSGEISMMPPTFVSLEKLSSYESTRQMSSALEEEVPEKFLPTFRMVPGGFCSLYHGDVAYDGGDIDQPGRRHRFWGLESGWWYERRD
ncbi:MAG: NUDIX domain-containing protein [Dehalococcoidia bacterium]